MIYNVEVEGYTRRLEVQRHGQDFKVSIDERQQVVEASMVDGVWSLTLLDQKRSRRQSFTIVVVERKDGARALEVYVNGCLVSVKIADSRVSWSQDPQGTTVLDSGPIQISAPMAGKVVKLLAQVGDTVVERQGVIVVEAMKMENELQTPKTGSVVKILVEEGTSVEAGTPLVVIE